MGSVLVETATIVCSHGGTIRVSAGRPRLTVQGSPVPTRDDLDTAQITCPLTGSGTEPCKKVTLQVGAAARLFIDGVPALLDTARGTTDSRPSPGTWTVIAAGQTTLDSD